MDGVVEGRGVYFFTPALCNFLLHPFGLPLHRASHRVGEERRRP
jgi:hypothetical protein